MNFLAFVQFVPINFETSGVSSKFKLRFHFDAFGDHEHCAPAGRSHAKRCCLKTDTTRFQTAPGQELLALDLTSFGRPCCIKGAYERRAHAQRSGGKGEGVEITMGVWQCQNNGSKAKINQTESNNESCGCI